MKKSSFFFIPLLALSVLLQSCAASYRQIYPDTLPFEDGADTLQGGDIVINWQNEVLRGAGNRYYSRMEKKHHVSLLGISIQNNGKEPFIFPRDVYILSEGLTLFPLDKYKMVERLSQEYNRNPSGSSDVVEGFWVLQFLSALITTSLRASADSRFQEEMDQYYLYSFSVPPGVRQIGLIAFPVLPGSPLMFKSVPKP